MSRAGLNDPSFKVAIGAPAVSPSVQVWRSGVTRSNSNVATIVDQPHRIVLHLLVRAQPHIRRKRYRRNRGERRIDSPGFKRELSQPYEEQASHERDSRKKPSQPPTFPLHGQNNRAFHPRFLETRLDE